LRATHRSIPESHDRSSSPDDLKVLFPGVLADSIVHDLDTEAVRQVQDLLDVLGRRRRRQQDVLRPVLLGEVDLGLGRDGADDVGANVLRELRVSKGLSALDRLAWTSKVPTPPEAARINTQSPFFTL